MRGRSQHNGGIFGRTCDGAALELQAYLLRRVGRFRDAYTTMLQASELEPRNVSVAYSLISTAFMSDDCDAAEAALEEPDGDSQSSADIALARTWLHALRGEQQGTRYWAEVWRIRRHDETKGDCYTESDERFYRAAAYAMVGLYDDAVNELKVMLEEPGGRGFQVVELWPAFDPIREHAGYVALRDRYSAVRRVSSN